MRQRECAARPPAVCAAGAGDGGKESEFTVVNPSENKRNYSSILNGDAPGTGYAQSMLDSPKVWPRVVALIFVHYDRAH